MVFEAKVRNTARGACPWPVPLRGARGGGWCAEVLGYPDLRFADVKPFARFTELEM